MKRNWILVANQAEAKIFASDRLPGALSLVNVLFNKEGATHPRDLVSDAPGRAHDGQGSDGMPWIPTPASKKSNEESL